MISRYFIERPVFANVIALVTIIIGLVCFYTLPVSQYPPHCAPHHTGNCPLPGG